MPVKIDVEHLGLPATNVNALQDWYVNVLGAKVVYRDEAQPACLLALGEVMIEIYPAEASLKETGNNKLSGWRHLALRIPSLEEARRELESKGVVFNEPVRPAAGGGQIQFFRDPEGNLLHFVERSKDSIFYRP